MIKRIYDYMIDKKMIARGSRILVAVSGGADSMCLLQVLAELQSRAGLHLRVFHVHHGLRESAERDLLHVSKYCLSADIPFEAVRVNAADYAAREHLSVEEAARHLRYEALEEAAQRWDREAEDRFPLDKCRIAVAHHLEDQAETVLFNLARGSRTAGLRGMLPVSGRIIRPLLECRRAQIEEFLVGRGICWQEDETNEDTAYTRNLLRREVMPLLEQINGKTAEHIAKAAQEAAETEEFLERETERALAACCKEQFGPDGRSPLYALSLPALLQEPPLLRRRVIYAVLAKAAGRKKDLQDVHVRDVLQLAQKQGNGRLDVFGGVTAEKVYEKLLFYAGSLRDPEEAGRRPADPLSGSVGRRPADPAANSESRRPADPAAFSDRRWPMKASEYSCRVFDFDGDLSTVSRNQYTKWLDYDKIGALPSFRTRRSGDRITLDESGRSKALRRYMIDAKIPAQLRDRIILPVVGSEVLWIPAGRADEPPLEKAAAKASHPPAHPPVEITPAEPAAAKTEIRRFSDGGRISASCLVSGSTRRILEIRWEEAR